MLAVGVRIQVMRVYVEWKESQGIQAGWMDNGHVIGSANIYSCHVCSSTSAHVRDSILFANLCEQQIRKTVFIILLEGHAA